MIKVDSISAPLTYPSTSASDRRLIVLVPGLEVDTAVVARKVWELANALERPVQFLGLSRDAAHEPGLRRQLVALSAMVGDGHISVESKIEFGNNWLNAVKSEWCDGDVIACFAEQRLGFPSKPLNQILESNLKATVYVLSGLHQPQKKLRPAWLSSALAWAGSIGILLGFLGLQMNLTHFPQDWTRMFLLYASIFVEVGAIWFWNSLFG